MAGLESWRCESNGFGKCVCGMFCHGEKDIVEEAASCSLVNRMLHRSYYGSDPARLKALALQEEMSPVVMRAQHGFDWSYSRMGPRCPADTCIVTQSKEKPEYRFDPMIDNMTPLGAEPALGVDESSHVRSIQWVLKFSDEFTSDKINKQRWNIVESHRGAKNGATKWWRKQNVYPDPKNGQVRLKFIKEVEHESGWMVLSSGNLNTDCKFEQKYGYYEARIRIVRPDAKQSAFWLMPNGGTWKNKWGEGPTGGSENGGEIDIMEAHSRSSYYATNIHWDGYGRYHRG